MGNLLLGARGHPRIFWLPVLRPRKPRPREPACTPQRLSSCGAQAKLLRMSRGKSAPVIRNRLLANTVPGTGVPGFLPCHPDATDTAGTKTGTDCACAGDGRFRVHASTWEAASKPNPRGMRPRLSPTSLLPPKRNPHREWRQSQPPAALAEPCQQGRRRQQPPSPRRAPPKPVGAVNQAYCANFAQLPLTCENGAFLHLFAQRLRRP